MTEASEVRAAYDEQFGYDLTAFMPNTSADQRLSAVLALAAANLCEQVERLAKAIEDRRSS